MSFRLPTVEEKAQYVQEQFERIAGRYDLTNDLISLGMHRLWKRRAVAELIGQTSGSYLDVCCGTGDLSLLLAQMLQGEGMVTGLDFSPRMLAVASDRAARAQPVPPVVWVEADAQNLPFSDNSFAGAIISFGLRNLTDLRRGLKEMARVVKPGGRVVNLDLGRSNLPVFAPIFQLYFAKFVPLLGWVVQGDRQAYTYLPESLKTYPEPKALSEIFCAAGLKDVKHLPLALGTVALHVGTVT